ncbi:MAG: GGDEF domain-containing protein [Thermoguttaceae bacterium]
MPAAVDLWSVPVPTPLALAVLVLLVYLAARAHKGGAQEAGAPSRREVRRAQSVAQELEKIAWMVRRHLARHHRSLTRFKERIGQLSEQQEQAAWKELCREATEILAPTLRLANHLAGAYDQIRQQTNQLMSFAEVRTDALTGVANRRALDEALSGQLALMARYGGGFSVAVFDIDHFKRVNDQQGHLQGDRALQQVAQLLDACARETDLVARYGGEEFVALMPRTDLQGASVFAERLRRRLQEETAVTVSGGVAEAMDGDTPDLLMSRADAALYLAKAAGRNCVFRHTGQRMEPVGEIAAASAQS